MLPFGAAAMRNRRCRWWLVHQLRSFCDCGRFLGAELTCLWSVSFRLHNHNMHNSFVKRRLFRRHMQQPGDGRGRRRGGTVSDRLSETCLCLNGGSLGERKKHPVKWVPKQIRKIPEGDRLMVNQMTQKQSLEARDHFLPSLRDITGLNSPV